MPLQRSLNHPTMRLTPDQHQIILTATREIFGAEAVVRLFGSRVDDAKRRQLCLNVKKSMITHDRYSFNLRFSIN
jgi:hypothetical protein